MIFVGEGTWQGAVFARLGRRVNSPTREIPFVCSISRPISTLELSYNVEAKLSGEPSIQPTGFTIYWRAQESGSQDRFCFFYFVGRTP